MDHFTTTFHITDEQQEELRTRFLNVVKKYSGDDYGLSSVSHELTKVPARIIIPNIGNIRLASGVFQSSFPKSLGCFDGAKEYLENSAEAGIYVAPAIRDGLFGSLLDYGFIYTEDNFVDRDGAGIMVNMNPDSHAYQRFIVYESFDDDRFTPLNNGLTLETIMDLAKDFIPDTKSDMVHDSYFVSYMADKYGMN